MVKLIESNHLIFENKPFGPVDLRTSESETNEEKQAAIESLESYNYPTDNKNILRLVTILEENNLKAAKLKSDLLFEETIDLLKRQPAAEVRIFDNAGYFVNMGTGETTPFIRKKDTNHSLLGNIYQTSLGPYSPMFSEQFILSKRNVESIEAFIRSIHWHNNSETQSRMYLKFLYKWIAIETISKVTDNENIIPKLCLVLNLPLSQHSKLVPQSEMEKLHEIKEYRHYREIVRGEFNNCRIMRNEIVHSGFKETNILDKNIELKLYLINCAYSAMINSVEKIILSGKNTLKEVWDVMHEYIIKDDKLKAWTTETFFKHLRDLTSGGKINGSEDLLEVTSGF